ncbi:MAG: hypothetical protein E6649_05270 [Paeniclostridium sordellii]|nr:hypothetical protein [Paeniclostridium sordellii]
MYREMTKELESDLNKEVLRTISLIFSDAVKVYESLIENESDIFSGDYFKSIKGKLLGFIINRAFDSKLLPSNLPFKAELIKLKFSQNTPKLVLQNTILTISKVMNLSTLPNKSKYKLEYARGNDLIENQIKIDLKGLVNERSPYFNELPYYGIIAYEYKDYLKSLNILIPDSDFKNIIKTINIPIVCAEENNGEDNKPILDINSLKESISNNIKLKEIK